MKSLSHIPSRGGLPARRRRRAGSLLEETTEIVHRLLNQLSVLSFCCFHLKNKAAGADALSVETDRLARAVEEAILCAERLSRVIAASARSQT